MLEILTNGINLLRGNPSKMVKYAQTNCLSVFDHFVVLALKGFKDCSQENVSGGDHI